MPSMKIKKAVRLVTGGCVLALATVGLFRILTDRDLVHSKWGEPQDLWQVVLVMLALFGVGLGLMWKKN